ncbi:MAG: hypothetical protein SGPRY_001615 [Prymnesium sp.]
MAHGVLRWLPLVLMVPPSLPFGRLRQLRQLRAHHLEGAPCFDSSDQCRRYAQEGQCESDPSYMGRECSQSCGLCDGRVDAIERDERAEEREFRSRFTGCTNNHASCASWARSGECEANPSFMSANCRASCAECESAACHDLEVGCSARAAKGECASNYTLLASCPFSCKRDPWILAFDDFLEEWEADHLVKVGGHTFQRSLAGDGVTPVRTSSTSWCNVDSCLKDQKFQDSPIPIF